MDVSSLNALIGATFGGFGVKLLDVYFTSRRERKAKKHHITNDENVFENALYFAPVGICITKWNLDFLQIRFMWINPMFTTIFGYTIEELENKDPTMLYGQNSRTDQIEKRQRVLSARRTYTDKNTFYRKDGTEVVCEWTEGGIFSDGIMYSVVSVIHELP